MCHNGSVRCSYAACSACDNQTSPKTTIQTNAETGISKLQLQFLLYYYIRYCCFDSHQPASVLETRREQAVLDQRIDSPGYRPCLRITVANAAVQGN